MRGRELSPGDAIISSQLPESYGHIALDFQLPAGSKGSFSHVSSVTHMQWVTPNK